MTTTIHLEQVDPATLGVLDQARTDATPDDALIASVKQHGILQPPTVAQIKGTNAYAIVTGHRRVGAAVAAGLTEITVLVRDSDIDLDAIHLEQQIVENERRKGLSAAELAQGYKKLELFGKTPADIARELGDKPERIRAGLKIHASTAASKLIDEQPTVDFEQAAIIAEFDEHPKLQSKLIETATTTPANFARDVANARTQREVDARVAKLKAQLEADGVPLADVVTYSSEWWTGKGVGQDTGRSLARLGIPVDEHTACPGHAAIIHGAQAYNLAAQPDTWLLYVCTDWEANGHTPASEHKSVEQQEREAQWERERAERAARQEIVDANNRARRTWIHGYLTTGRLRPTAAHFDIMAEAAAIQLENRMPTPAHITLELLTGEPVERRHSYQSDSNDDALVTLIRDAAIPNLRILVATALATYEDAIEAPGVGAYFSALAEWGYTPTDTDREHLAAATNTDDEGGTADYSDYDIDEEQD